MSAFNHPENGIPLPYYSHNKELLRETRHIIFAEKLRILEHKILLSDLWDHFAPYGASLVAGTTVEPPSTINDQEVL